MAFMHKKFSKIFSRIFAIFLCYESMGCETKIIGQPLPNFSLPPFQDSVTGQSFPPVISQTLRGKKTLIVVWASWCGFCASLHHQLMDIAKQGEWRIVGINVDSNPQDAALFLSKNGNPYSALSPRRAIRGLPLSGGIPLVYAISADGIIRAQQRGAPRHGVPLSPSFLLIQ